MRFQLNKILPRFAIFPLILTVVINMIVYSGSRILMRDAHHYDITSSIDEMIPLVPAWTVVYLICFAFWVINYLLACRESREQCYRFLSAEAIAKLICGLCFILFPTTNVRPDTVDGVFGPLLELVYLLDAPDNLFPSIHCLVSWFCFRGLKGCKTIPRWYYWFSFVFALLIFASTLFTKQHVIVDVVGGVVVAEIGIWLSRHLRADRIYWKINFLDRKKV